MLGYVVSYSLDDAMFYENQRILTVVYLLYENQRMAGSYLPHALAVVARTRTFFVPACPLRVAVCPLLRSYATMRLVICTIK